MFQNSVDLIKGTRERGCSCMPDGVLYLNKNGNVLNESYSYRGKF